ncbi:MFS transporter [Thermodesulfobacteriota bacterium]
MKDQPVKAVAIPETEADSFRMRFVPILFLVGMESFNVLSRVIFSPLLLDIEADLHLSHAQAARFFLLISGGLSFTMFFSGVISSKITHRQTIILAGVLISISLVTVSYSNSLAAIQISLVLLGMGAGLYLPSGIATVNALVIQKDIGKAMATHELGPTLGLVAAPLLVGALSNVATWRSILFILGLANLGMVSLYAMFAKGGNFYGLKPHFKTLRIIVKDAR